jgi:hypothetical protein
MGMRIPGILAPKKVAMVAGVATGTWCRTGVLHAVNAEHCPGGRRHPSRTSSPCQGPFPPILFYTQVSQASFALLSAHSLSL